MLKNKFSYKNNLINSKYTLKETSIPVPGSLFEMFKRLIALRDIYYYNPRTDTHILYCKKGEEGGLVSGEHNLSKKGNAWIDKNAKVWGNAIVEGDALLTGNAVMYDYAKLRDNALVGDNAELYGHAQVTGNGAIYGDVKLYDAASVIINGVIGGEEKIGGRRKIDGRSDLTKKYKAGIIFYSYKKYDEENKKYSLTANTKIVHGVMLYQIIALKNFGKVKKDELGGWVESEENLSQEGDCWIGCDVCVFKKARVKDNAQVDGFVHIFNSSYIESNAVITNIATSAYTSIHDHVVVSDNARLDGSVMLNYNVTIFGKALISDKSYISRGTIIGGATVVKGRISDNSIIAGDVKIDLTSHELANIMLRKKCTITDHMVDKKIKKLKEMYASLESNFNDMYNIPTDNWTVPPIPESPSVNNTQKDIGVLQFFNQFINDGIDAKGVIPHRNRGIEYSFRKCKKIKDAINCTMRILDTTCNNCQIGYLAMRLNKDDINILHRFILSFL